ncbi:ATP-dependent sacrificial sulfur transferase LarE [candidate division TA06 bacterium]|nr:ATP-dependent sacrificial sulfur transferase LarE [candidate division TA06 bacterium]
MGNVLVAYSGGVDSTYLLKVAHEQLNGGALAVTAQSDSLAREELEEAKKMAQRIGVRHRIIQTKEVEKEEYASNPINRCYFCKEEVYQDLREIAEKEKISYLLDGFQMDDVGDFRPGIKAAREWGVRSPLKEAQLKKEEIRFLSREMGLPTWEKPSGACLSSRIPYGSRITPEKLHQIEEAEAFLHTLGFREVRVRHHGDFARIEVPKERIKGFLKDDIRDRVISKLKELGFSDVTLDLQGYRTGSLNEKMKQRP